MSAFTYARLSVKTSCTAWIFWLSPVICFWSFVADRGLACGTGLTGRCQQLLYSELFSQSLLISASAFLRFSIVRKAV